MCTSVRKKNYHSSTAGIALEPDSSSTLQMNAERPSCGGSEMVHRRACCRPAMCYDGGKFVTEKSEVVLQSLGELCAAAAEAVCLV